MYLDPRLHEHEKSRAGNRVGSPKRGYRASQVTDASKIIMKIGGVSPVASEFESLARGSFSVDIFLLSSSMRGREFIP